VEYTHTTNKALGVYSSVSVPVELLPLHLDIRSVILIDLLPLQMCFFDWSSVCVK
jgi:hypothetical protein